MSAALVLEPMAEPRHCEHTGLSIPECCCRRCCEAQLRRYAPWLLNGSSTQVAEPAAVVQAELDDRAALLWSAEEYAASLGISVVELHRLAQAAQVLA